MKGEYGQSEHGNFKVVDTIGVPHPYCITPRHVAVASDHFGGMLGKEAVAYAEEHGVHCGVRGCQLTYEEHKQALLVGCWDNLKTQTGQAVPELHDYLMSIKDECEKNGYAGFSFVDKRP